MKKLLLALTLLLAPVLAWAGYPDTSGEVEVKFHLESSGELALPEIFQQADKIYITTKNDGWDKLRFYKNGELIHTVNINERTGENDGGAKITYLNHNLDHIYFDWETDKGVHKFRSNSVKWNHKNSVGTFFNFTFGAEVTFEVKLTRE